MALAREEGKEPLHVEAIGHQWWWEFRYEDANPDVEGGELITTANEMRIPVDRPVIMTLKSDDVIHSFWIPKLAGKQDVVPTRRQPDVVPGRMTSGCTTANAPSSAALPTRK